MNWSLFIVFAILIVLLCFAGIYIRRVNRDEPYLEQKSNLPADCCGAHAVCERDSLLSRTDEIIYFDDEELDELAGIAANEYGDREIKMIEDVFYTMREQDVAGWLRSLQLRNIELPEHIRDEALFIVTERRQTRLENNGRKD
ncbi:MAG: phospholipase [Paludibacteraceae bacterium]|nr:phospholipase [Paludibacteraceae bacterium]